MKKIYKLYKSGKILVTGMTAFTILSTATIVNTYFDTPETILADTNKENSQADWPQTNGNRLAGSNYGKAQTFNFSENNNLSKDYSATPKLNSQNDLKLFIQGTEKDINSLSTDGTGGKPKTIKTSEMGSDTYFYASNVMSVLQDNKYIDVDLKLTILSTDLGNNDTTVGFGVKGTKESGNKFLSTGSGKQVAQRGNFTNFKYQFFNHDTGKPMSVKFHMGFTDIDFEEAIKVQESAISKIYVDNNSKLPYAIKDGNLAITRDYNDNADKNDSSEKGYTHVALFEIDAPEDGFNLSIATSGNNDKDPNAISQGSKVAPSILDTMKYNGNIEVNYVDQDSQKLSPSEYSTDTIGNSYTTKPKEIAGYKLVETPANANGTYTDGTTTVTYVYQKETPVIKQGDLVVNYVDQDGKTLASSDSDKGDVDSAYTTKPKEIAGYKLVETPANANGTYTDGTTTVTYVYQKETPVIKQGDLVVNYVDQDGKTLASSDSDKGDVDSAYTTKPKEIAGYKLVETPANVNGTYTDGTTTVTYVYQKETPVIKQGDLVVNYVDQDGKTLASSDSDKGDVDSAYTTKPKEIAGYKLVETPANANGTYTDGTTTVTYVYQKETPVIKQGDLVVNYVDQDGKTLASSDSDKGDVDSAYTTKPKEIAGYKLVETPANVNGTYTDGTTTVTYVYQKETPVIKQGDLVVNYVDQDGKTLASSDSDKGDVDSAYTTKPKEIAGYKLVETPANANGTYTDGTTTVTYVYQKETPVIKQGDLVVNYVDQDGKTLASSDSDKGDVDSAYTTKPKEIAGYKLVETPANANGIYTDGTTTVTYVYQKETPVIKQGDLVVNYVDQDGKTLASSDSDKGDVDSAYTTKPKEIAGYKLVETPANANGTYTDGTTTVTYVYQKETPVIKQGDLVVNYVDQDGKTLASSDSDKGDVDSAYTTKPKEIAGYKLVETPANANGTYTDGTTTVTYVYQKETPVIKQGDLVVNYVDQDGKTLASSDSDKGDVDSAYTTKPKEIAGYKLVETPANANGTYTDGTTTVTYVYQKETPVIKQGDLVVNYVDSRWQN
ncbi:MucBP domain-containing protein, partial [Leuconostoc litchii]|uniref:MucBP domain-containing protein n=1 Tax=Leuconostoc litchii TaxID=1981069 RepID=UPI0024E18828